MQYVFQTVDDAESNIFEGLQALTDEDVALPAEWRDDIEDHGLERFTRDALNLRFDMELTGWECRLA